MDMLSLPSVTGGIQSPFTPTDGLVHVSSALAHKGRAVIVDTRSTAARLILDESAIEGQKPVDTIANRLFPDYSHLDIVIGKSPDDTKLFGQIADDILWFKKEYDRVGSYAPSSGERAALIEKIKTVALLGWNRNQPLADGIRIYKGSVISAQEVWSSTEKNRSTVILKVQKSMTVVKNDGQSYVEVAFTETYTATFGRVNGIWYWVALQ